MLKFMMNTLVLFKPDILTRNLVGSVLKTIEENGFVIKNMKYFQFSKIQCELFYQEHVHKGFFQSMQNYLCSLNTIGLILEKEDAINAFRQLAGATDPKKAEPNTIRYMYGIDIDHNSVHGTDKQEVLEREIEIIFGFQKNIK